ERITGIGVQNTALLHVRAVADHDRLVVAADHRRRPDVHVATDLHRADDRRVFVDEGGWIDAWNAVAELVDRHRYPCWLEETRCATATTRAHPQAPEQGCPRAGASFTRA